MAFRQKKNTSEVLYEWLQQTPVAVLTAIDIATLSSMIQRDPMKFLTDIVNSLPPDPLKRWTMSWDCPAVADPTHDPGLLTRHMIPGPVRTMSISLSEIVVNPSPCGHKDAAVSASDRTHLTITCPCGAQWEMNRMVTQERWHVTPNKKAMKR